jgi:biotin operon repressor
MKAGPSFPKRGLPAYLALRRWSDAGSYSELVRLSGMKETDDLPSHERSSEFIRDTATRKEYDRKREAVEEAFRLKLIDGIIVCSAIPEHGDGPEMIKPALWEELEIAYDLDGDIYGIRRFRKPEFFEPSSIPTNVLDVPDWLVGLAAQAVTESPGRSDSELILFAQIDSTFVVGESERLSKADAELFGALFAHRKLDETRDRELTDYSFMHTDDLANALGEDDVSLRKRVARLRKKIGAAAIESVKWRGYRLSPALVQVPPAVIRSRTNAKKSHKMS